MLKEMLGINDCHSIVREWKRLSQIEAQIDVVILKKVDVNPTCFGIRPAGKVQLNSGLSFEPSGLPHADAMPSGNRKLTSKHIQSLYDSGACPSPKPLPQRLL